MFTSVLNSPRTLPLSDQSLNTDLNERINSLQTSLINQLELVPKATSSLQQIFHLIPIIFRYLHKNLQSQQKLFNEYNDLSNNIQNLISLCAQYNYDRYKHENESLVLKNKISQILEQIGYTKISLEQYWTMIHSLEDETERLQILLSNPQLLKINQRKFQTLQQTQKIKLDRLIKENEKIKSLIHKQVEAIKTIQINIEADVKKLEKLKTVFHDIELEQKDNHSHWSQIERETSHLQTTLEKTKNMQNECNDKLKTTKIQFDHVQKELNTLTNTRDETKQKLLAIQTDETNIKQEVENVKKEIMTEQTRSLTCRQQIQNLRQQAQQLESAKRHDHHKLEAEKHTNSNLECQRLTLKNAQSKLHDHVQNLTRQFTSLTQQNQRKEHALTNNRLYLETQQHKIKRFDIGLKKLIHFNNNLEKHLQENHLIQINEREKLRQIKQISYEKRKQLLISTKRLHILSINEYHLRNNTIRNSLEIIRLNNTFNNLNTNEKCFESIIRKKKHQMMIHEKERTTLHHYIHDNENHSDYLVKKNQLIENELQSKMDHFRSLQQEICEQKHDEIILSKQKQYLINTYQEKSKNLNEINQKLDQSEKFSEYEIDHIQRKNQENEQFKSNIQNMKQQIIHMISKNKRQFDEYSLVNQKIQLYTQLNDAAHQQEHRCMAHKNQFISKILSLQQENNRLVNNLEKVQKKKMMICTSYHDKLIKKNNLYKMHKRLLNGPLIIRDSPMRMHTEKSLEDYMTFVNRLMEIIQQCVQWREKLLWINQIYLEKIQQIHQQTKFLLTKDEMNLRYKIQSKIKHCKAMRAELISRKF